MDDDDPEEPIQDDSTTELTDQDLRADPVLADGQGMKVWPPWTGGCPTVGSGDPPA